MRGNIRGQKHKSSANNKWLIRDFPTKHPTFILFSSFDRSSMYIAKKYGLNVIPCLTALVTENTKNNTYLI